MQLTNKEISQLKAEGYNDNHIEQLQFVKAEAFKAGLNWTSLFTKLIEHGPELIAIVKMFGGLINADPKTPAQVPAHTQSVVQAWRPNEESLKADHSNEESPKADHPNEESPKAVAASEDFDEPKVEE